MTIIPAAVETSNPMPDLVINEVFGPTVQGEGPQSGRRCAFVRLGGCNLSCRWCDTAYTWDWKGVTRDGPFDPKIELHRRGVEEVLEQLRPMKVDTVVVSGGEPLNQPQALTGLAERLCAEGFAVDIETNGTRLPPDELVGLVRTMVVSPKLAHAGDVEHLRLVPRSLLALAALPSAHFKFVVRNCEDLDEVSDVVGRFGLPNVWIMPAGRDPDTLVETTAAIADEVVRRGWNLSTRLHVLAWADRRGM